MSNLADKITPTKTEHIAAVERILTFAARYNDRDACGILFEACGHAMAQAMQHAPSQVVLDVAQEAAERLMEAVRGDLRRKPQGFGTAQQGEERA